MTAEELGIPELDLAMQATAPPSSWVKWGTMARSSPVPSGCGYHFYTSDDKFAGAWKRPEVLPASGVGAAVEVNYTTLAGTPLVWVLFDVYRKRWLARRWQSLGVRMFVDLNVAHRFQPYNLLGVPPGWSAYATRKHHGGTEADQVQDFEAATERAGGNPVTFCVFGGGRKTRSLCERMGWHWIAEHQKSVRGLT